MNKLLFASIVLLGIACSETEENPVGGDVLSKPDVTYVYPVQYSKFEMGDPSFSQKITELWKDYDENTFEKHKSYFADTVTMEFPGYSSTGPVDSMLAGAKADRQSVDKVESSILAIMSVKNYDDEAKDYVMVWGSDKRTGKDGKIDSTRMHEVWGFNKEGKVDYMAQYRQ